MPLGTLDRTAPPLFNQGQSALSKLIFFGALSLFLMVADARFHIVQPIRAAIGAVLYPVQWVALKPVQAVHFLIAAAELHLKVHEFGKSKDAAAAAAAAATGRPE